MEMAYNELKNNIGQRVAELRKMNNWTQEQCAEQANVTVQYLQRIEQGKENLTLFSLLKIAKLFKVTIVELFQNPTTEKNKRGRPSHIK